MSTMPLFMPWQDNWALQGEFRQALAAWEKARHLNPSTRLLMPICKG